MLKNLLEKHKSDFEIIKIEEPEHLEECRRTTFSYTKMPSGLCLAADKKYFNQGLDNPNIKGIVALPSAVVSKDRYEKAIIVANHGAELFYFLHNYAIHEFTEWKSKPVKRYISATSQIDSTAVLAENVHIGENVIISAGCILRDYSVIGDNTILHPGVIIGADGVFSKCILGEKAYIKHHGGVRIGKNCVFHAASVAVRSANYNEFTEVNGNVHVGIRSSVGHDCYVGEDCDISSGVLVSGRVTLGRRCWIGAGAIISNALTIGDSASVRIGSVVVENVRAGGDVSGNFAVDHQSNIKNFIRSKG